MVMDQIDMVPWTETLGSQDEKLVFVYSCGLKSLDALSVHFMTGSIRTTAGKHVKKTYVITLFWVLGGWTCLSNEHVVIIVSDEWLWHHLNQKRFGNHSQKMSHEQKTLRLKKKGWVFESEFSVFKCPTFSFVWKTVLFTQHPMYVCMYVCISLSLSLCLSLSVLLLARRTDTAFEKNVFDVCFDLFNLTHILQPTTTTGNWEFCITFKEFSCCTCTILQSLATVMNMSAMALTKLFPDLFWRLSSLFFVTFISFIILLTCPPFCIYLWYHPLLASLFSDCVWLL